MKAKDLRRSGNVKLSGTNQNGVKKTPLTVSHAIRQLVDAGTLKGWKQRLLIVREQVHTHDPAAAAA